MIIDILKAIWTLYLTVLKFCLSLFIGIIDLAVAMLIIIVLILYLKTHK